MTNAEIGNKIKYARDLRNATLDDIAKKVGVAKSTIQRYENGKINNIKIPVIDSIAIALNVNPSWIIGKSDIMEIPPQTPLKIVEYYEMLNDAGKHEATKRVRELTFVPEYSRSLGKELDTEIACEIQLNSYPYFSNVKEAKKYIEQHDVAAFKGLGNLTDTAIIEMANTIKAASTSQGESHDI